MLTGVFPATPPVTVRLIVVVCVKLPDVPVTVTVDVPVAAVLLAVKVSVLVPVVVDGLNDAVTPLGKPEADKLTLPLNPFNLFTVIVLVPELLCETLKLLGDADKLKSPVAALVILHDVTTSLALGLNVVKLGVFVVRVHDVPLKLSSEYMTTVQPLGI